VAVYGGDEVYGRAVGASVRNVGSLELAAC
jgi:hypothetical protein